MRAVREPIGMFEGDESCVLFGQYFLKFVSNTSSLRERHFRNLDKDANKNSVSKPLDKLVPISE